MTAATSRVGLEERLSRAIRSACLARGDDEICIALLITACAELDVHSQRDLAEHFEQVACEWGAPVMGPSGEPWSTGNSKPERELFGDVSRGVMP